MSETKVINNTQENLHVRVETVNGDIHITISKKVDLSVMNPGEIFEMGGEEFIVLRNYRDIKNIVVIRKNVLDEGIKFSNINNDYRSSIIRDFLHTQYYPKICEIFGVENIVKTDVDLLSLSGLDNYGYVEDYVTLMGLNEYRSCREYLGNSLHKPWWLLTPRICF